MNLLAILLGQFISFISRSFNLGNGSTWPGHLALKLNHHFISSLLKNSKTQIVLIAGTNGKTTTSLLIKTILESNGKTTIHNSSGANLLNGIASALVLQSSWTGKLNTDYAIFEVDENALSKVLQEIDPQYVLLLNLFRDQLDRYGEVANVAKKWAEALKDEPTISLILNADDPQIAFIGQQLFNHKKVQYFGLSQQGINTPEHAADSTYCPRCGTKLNYKTVYYSHIGNWECPHCQLKQPQTTIEDFPYMPLEGLYNVYNTLAAVLLCKDLDLSEKQIEAGLKSFNPAFGRQEKIEYAGKQLQFFLSKNPTGFNQSIQTIRSLNAKTILLALNDRFADGTDVSWIWDVDFEKLSDFADNIIITGDRAYDLAVRLKYSRQKMTNEKLKVNIETDLNTSIQRALGSTAQTETLFILPTYTAMLDIRKIVSGRKIL